MTDNEPQPNQPITTPTSSDNPTKDWKHLISFLKTEDGKFTTEFAFRLIKVFAPNAWVAFWDFLLVLTFLSAIIICSAYSWIEKRTAETLLVLVIGTIIGAKFKQK
jgi:hypothetical protein